MNQVVLDLETQRSFEEVGGRDNFKDLGVSLVGLYHYETDQFETFQEKELARLEPILSQASRIIGFNIRRFDFPVLQPYFKNLRLSEFQALDLLEVLEKELGHRVSLQSVAQATLGIGKKGSGLDAIEYYRKGEIDRLKEYCLEDVRITKEIYEFGKRFQKVYFTPKNGTGRLEAKIVWKDPEPVSNLSLF